MIDWHKVGETYVGPDKMLFVVVQSTQIGVVVLVLQDNPAYTKPMKAGTVMNLLNDTAYWDESVPFASLSERSTVSP